MTIDKFWRAYTTDKFEAYKFKIKDRQPDFNAIKNWYPQVTKYINMTSRDKVNRVRRLPPSQWKNLNNNYNHEIDFKWEFSLMWHQSEAVEYLKKIYNIWQRSSMIVSWTASWKCLWKWTWVIMYDWRSKNIEDITQWESVMWPDSNPRTVMSTTTWRDILYRITTIKWESFICNWSHILVLQASYRKRKYEKWDYIYISVNDYLLKWKNWKHQFKIKKSEWIDMKEKNIKIDPYFLWYRLWNWDRHTSDLTINSNHKNIFNRMQEYATNNWLYMRKKKQRWCHHVSLSNNTWSKVRSRNKNSLNVIKEWLASYNLFNNKHIPDDFIYTSKEIRYRLLAWLIDSDWFIDADWVSLVFNNTNKKIIDAVYYIWKSLWLSVKIHKRKTYFNEKECISWNVSMSWDTYLIPTLHKKAQKRVLNKCVTRSWFTVENIWVWDYYWFELDWDHLFILDNFIVQHNSYIILGILSTFRKRTLIIVPSTIIWLSLQKIISTYCDCKFMTADEYRKVITKPNVLVMNWASYNKVRQNLDYSHIVTDEFHHLSLNRISQYNQFKWDFIVWLTATPERKEFWVDWFRMFIWNVYDTNKQSLPVRILKYQFDYNYSIEESMKAQKWLAPDSPEFYRRLYWNNDTRNLHLKNIIDKLKAKWFRRMIIFTDRLDHVERISKVISPTFILTWETNKQKFLDDVGKVDDYIILAMSSCAWEWMSINNLECWILFLSTSWNNTIDQLAGRMRRYDWNKENAYMIDFIDNIQIAWSKTKKLWWYGRQNIYKLKWRDVLSFNDYVLQS
jgi:hypothetical protein